jgi:hypothetical protein
MHKLTALCCSHRRRRQNVVQNNAQPSPSSAVLRQEINQSPENQPENIQKRDESSDARSLAKSALTLTLELAEKALDGLPIPGAKGTIGAVLRVMKNVEVSIRANAE